MVIFEKIDLNKIDSLIDSLDILDIHKQFYKTMIKERYYKILRFSYNKLKGEIHEKHNH